MGIFHKLFVRDTYYVKDTTVLSASHLEVLFVNVFTAAMSAKLSEMEKG